jgi:prephenate dehydrogenase
VDRAESNLGKAVQDADLVVLCTPVGRFETLAGELSGVLSEGTVVTDVGSVKGSVVAMLEAKIGSRGSFVGGHPIAGREKSGVRAASAELFGEAVCILTPTDSTRPGALVRVELLWEGIGCRVLKMDPGRHDRIFSAVSHLPHVVAYVLVNLLQDLEAEEPDLIDYAAGGFRDFTRIAASSPEMWRDICLENAEAILGRIGEYQGKLEILKQLIETRDAEGLLKVLTRAKSIQEKLG